MTRAAKAVIDVAALRHNLHKAKAADPRAKHYAVIKADAYGHGLVPVAQALHDADGFCVACLEEARALREAGISRPILLLEGFFDATELDPIITLGLNLVVHQIAQVEALEAAAERLAVHVPVQVWLKVDTGMHRLGFPLTRAAEAWQRLKACPLVADEMVMMTHLASADDFHNPATQKQLDAFAEFTAGQGMSLSIANSAGILGWMASHADYDRPGILLYGASPFVGETAAARGLRPVMQFRSELIAIQQLNKGDAVGYGGAWVCPEDMPVGVVGVGYGDGYPRHAPPGTPVLVRGRQVPLVGRVSMDMISVDLRSLPEARIGDVVTLWGEGLPAETVAEAADTIAYQLFCGVTGRVPRVYLDEGSQDETDRDDEA